MGRYAEYGSQGLGLVQTEFAHSNFDTKPSRYDDVLRKILGEGYQGELLGILKRRGLIPNEQPPQLYLPPDRHEGSKARYLLDFYNGDDRILVPIMGPWKKTSQHLHREPIIEEYVALAGELYLNGSIIPSHGLIVPPGVVHQAETRSQYALTLIVMRNAALVPKKEQHIRLT